MTTRSDSGQGCSTHPPVRARGAGRLRELGQRSRDVWTDLLAESFNTVRADETNDDQLITENRH